MVVDDIFLIVILAGTVVPGDLFSTDDYHADRYYDHIIDLSLERLKVIGHDFQIDVHSNDPKYGFGIPVRGTIIFDNLLSLNTTYTTKYGSYRFTPQIKRLKNGDLDLLATLKFGNISGTGNFTGHGKEGRFRHDFVFNTPSPEVEILFMMTNDSTRKRVTFQFVKPPVYDYPRESPINIQLLLEEKVPIVLNRLFKKLYDILYERLILTAPRHEPKFEKIVDDIFQKIRLEKNPVETGFNVLYMTSGENHTEEVEKVMNMTVYGLDSLTRASTTSVVNEINGDLNLLVTIKFGNISGTATINSVFSDRPTANVPGSPFSISLGENYDITSPPTVAEVSLYIPRNRSHHQYSIHFLEKPQFTISIMDGEILRGGYVARVFERHGDNAYGKMLHTVLKETQNYLFP